jgi:hypothetical protein
MSMMYASMVINTEVAASGPQIFSNWLTPGKLAHPQGKRRDDAPEYAKRVEPVRQAHLIELLGDGVKEVPYSIYTLKSRVVVVRALAP